ncbi:prpE protein, partial [Vibrio cholerae O1 str. EM-1546]
QASD